MSGPLGVDILITLVTGMLIDAEHPILAIVLYAWAVGIFFWAVVNRKE